jgi:uncharacterized protein
MVLGLLALILGFGAHILAIPGGWFVAAMIVAIIAGLVRPNHPRISHPVLVAVQAVIGTMLGITIRSDALPILLLHFPVIIGVTGATIATGLIAGVVLPRISSLNRETAIMGTLPGGASAMILMSVGTKADTKMVALMQYLRLVLVVMSAALVASFLVHHTPGASQSLPVQSSAFPHNFVDFLLTPVVAILGVWIGRLIHLPTSNLLGPLLLGLLISALNIFHLVWPIWIPWIAYVLMGFYVGLLFDRESLIQTKRLLPLLIANSIVLITLCALISLIFDWFTGASLLSGYLATSPGGGDSIAIIALGSNADVLLVFSVQIFRLLIIVFTGPFLIKTILHLTRKPKKYRSMDVD